jgi:hypothetical protein
MMRIDIPTLALVLAIAGNTQTAFAQSAGLPTSHSAISNAALADSVGNIAVNNSAGAGNAQANIAVISIGEELAGAAIASRQEGVQGFRATRGNQIAEIGDNAFRNASGIIAVNQSSGNGNIQANLVAIAVGNVSEVSIDQLSRVSAPRDRSSNTAGNAEESGRQQSVIADSAFIGARGIVQVNQLAGSGNSSANMFALSIGAGAQ